MGVSAMRDYRGRPEPHLILSQQLPHATMAASLAALESGDSLCLNADFWERGIHAPEAAPPCTAAIMTPQEHPTGGGLNILTDGPWLARTLGMCNAASASTSPNEPTVFLDVPAFWAAVWDALPAATCGRGSHTQYFGLLFRRANVGIAHVGSSADSRSSLQLDGVEMCPEPFVWEPSMPAGGQPMHVSARELHEDLDLKLEAFLSSVFAPWASNWNVRAGQACAAWLVCNDGDAFALSRPLLNFGKCGDNAGRDSWCNTVVVCDRAKSTAVEPILEVFSTSGSEPERLVYDMCIEPATRNGQVVTA